MTKHLQTDHIHPAISPTRKNSALGARLLSHPARNLTQPKQTCSYEYEHDYENRIIKITKDGSVVFR